MAEMTEYEIQRVQKHIDNIQKKYDSIRRAIERSNIRYDLSTAQSNVERYRRIVTDAQKHAEDAIKKALSGSGFFFRTEGFNDIINAKSKEVSAEITKTLDDYDSEIHSMLSHLGVLGRVSTNSHIFDEDEYGGDKEYTGFAFSDDGVETNTYSNTYEEDVVDEVFDDNIDEEVVDEMVSPVTTGMVTSLSSVLDSDELEGRRSTTVVEKPKRVVITKKTALDNDEIKEIFLSRHAEYSLTMQQLNKAIGIVGNNVDKDAILLEALQLRFFDYIPTFDYFYCYTTLSKAMSLAMKLGKYDLALDFVFGILCLETSGYLMAHSKWKERKKIFDVFVDPALTGKHLETIKENITKTSNEVIELYTNSSFVNKLISSMPAPLFSLENSAKIMVMAYENPYERYNCNELGLPYNK